jgi:hypothetical protein
LASKRATSPVEFKFAPCVIGADDFKLAEVVKGDGTSCDVEVGVEGEVDAEVGLFVKPRLGGAVMVTKSGAIRATINAR